VLSQMVGVANRRARFVCAAALVHSGGELVLERSWEGSLADEPAGSGGFGYDPIFVPEGDSRTSSELSDEGKDALSHRGQAFRALAEHLLALG
jgi:XTP/dITP diphosphohydrolase